MDKEKVVNGLKTDVLPFLQHHCDMQCDREKRWISKMIITVHDALTLLKEQEAVRPVLDEQTGRIWLCGKCGSYVGFEDNDPHDPNEFDKYCRDCGAPVLWEGNH